MRRLILITLKAWNVAVVVVGTLVLTLWGTSVVATPYDCHFLLDERLHIAAGEGRLILCNGVAEIDGAGNVIPEMTNLHTYRGEPPIIDCRAGSVAGFRWNYCEFCRFTEWSLILPIRPILVLLVISAVGTQLLVRRLTNPARPASQTPSVTA